MPRGAPARAPRGEAGAEPRAARRTAGPFRLAGIVIGVLATTSCGGVGLPAAYEPTGIDGLVVPTPSPEPEDFGKLVDNPWWPLSSVELRRYDVEEGGRRVGTVTVEATGREVVAGLDATAVVTRTQVRGEPPTSVTRWYAQDDAANVWLVGEDDPGAGWRAGERGALAGLVMPAEPRVGDAWVTAEVPGVPAETVLVEEPVTAETGGDDTVRATRVDRDGVRTEELYVEGVGLVRSARADGRTLTLVEPAA